MILLKKLTFAPLFLIVFALFAYQLTPFLKSYDFIFSLSINTLLMLIALSFYIFFSCLLFILFATLAHDLKLVLPVAFLSALTTLFFLEPALALIFAVAIFISLLFAYLSLDNSLKSYLTFKPEALLGPAVRVLSGFLIAALCLIYFFSASKIIAQNGFQIPDSLIDTALKMAPTNLTGEQEAVPTQLPSISQEQLDVLKKNPELVRQSGLDPKILDTLNQPKSAKAPQILTQDLIKQTIKDQIQNFIKPYINFIPAILAVLLFLTLQSFVAMINLLIYPLLWLTFYILEKTGFVKFEVEQRPVKKLVV
ncbi:MAG: hypothetical protein Q7R82_00550 [Candidatus Daviesbacteria bacterium]|nr:hypothetical protein [Candidatus Daviesbacteria bacterium]